MVLVESINRHKRQKWALFASQLKNLKPTLGITGYQGLRGPGLHADCFVLGNCSCLGTGREMPCTVQMRSLELGGFAEAHMADKAGAPDQDYWLDLAALWPPGPTCMSFEYDFWFSWRIPDLSHKEHSVHLNHCLNVMLAIIFYDRKRESLFSWPVGIPKDSPDRGAAGSQLPQVSADEAMGIQSSPAPVPCPLSLATGRWSGAHRVVLPLCVYCQGGTCGISDHYELNKVILPEEPVSDRGSESLLLLHGQVLPGQPWKFLYLGSTWVSLISGN